MGNSNLLYRSLYSDEIVRAVNGDFVNTDRCAEAQRSLHDADPQVLADWVGKRLEAAKQAGDKSLKKRLELLNDQIHRELPVIKRRLEAEEANQQTTSR